MYKLLLVIAMVFILSGCSQDPKPSPAMQQIIGATPVEQTYNFDVTLEWESSVGAGSEAEARKEVDKIFKDIYGFKLAEDLIILKSVTQ